MGCGAGGIRGCFEGGDDILQTVADLAIGLLSVVLFKRLRVSKNLINCRGNDWEISGGYLGLEGLFGEKTS